MRPQFVERCKEWLREMLRTSKRKKPVQTITPEEKATLLPGMEEEDEIAEEDDIIMYDSDNEGKRPLRKRVTNLAENNVDDNS